MTTEVLELKHEFNAPIEKVFLAWTTPEYLVKWFGPQEFEVLSAEVDLQFKGKYSITLKSPDNKIIEHSGEYLEIEKPNKLVFTWILENQACGGSAGHYEVTIVDLSFTQQQELTILYLRHERLPNKASYDGHKFGWQSSLKGLDHLINS